MAAASRADAAKALLRLLAFAALPLSQLITPEAVVLDLTVILSFVAIMKIKHANMS